MTFTHSPHEIEGLRAWCVSTVVFRVPRLDTGGRERERFDPGKVARAWVRNDGNSAFPLNRANHLLRVARSKKCSSPKAKNVHSFRALILQAGHKAKRIVREPFDLGAILRDPGFVEILGVIRETNE